MDIKRTDWFQGDITPVRVGVYERLYHIGATPSIRYSYWNGKKWCFSGTTVSDAMAMSDEEAPRQKLAWRGLKEKP